MQSKKEIEKELEIIKKQLKTITNSNSSLKGMLSEKGKNEANETSSQMFTLLKYMIEENKKTSMLINGIFERIAKLEETLEGEYAEEEAAPAQPKADQPSRELPLSSVDVKIIQIIQMSQNGMACAEDVMKQMKYKGRNAASSRLNRLFKLGAIERYQLGHKVYYKYDASGKAAKILIVSPPQ
ncbi:MAG: hypothetical protein M1559_01770 [Candidatus Marsarchaeota archaeon]|jgi:hypothetical protein|nr:hypothetical protein [Candidatus Marsarchaeota archaeon]